jgi:GT2 family glycosyltransferase
VSERNLLSIIIPVLHLKRPINMKRFFMPRQTIVDTLADIEKNVRMSHEVIVLCNGQDADLVDFVRNHKAITRYCLNSQNAGVARSWNMGAQLADGDILCYVNDDVSVGVGAMESLTEQLLQDPSVGEIGPAGSYWRDCQHHSYVESKHPVEADVVSGFCFLLRASTLHDLGGFDIAYSPAGCEEIDLSYKVRKAGMKCLVDPRADIKHYHHHGVSSQRVDIHYLGHSIDTETLHQRNSSYFRKKWKAVFP